ncbi:hypothetical protein D9M71_736430 [compost metagenome]
MLAELERHRQVGVRHDHPEAPRRPACGGQRVVLRAEPANPLTVCQGAVELRRAEIVAVCHACLQYGVVAPLLANLGVLDEAVSKAAREAELHPKHVVLAAPDHALQLEIHRPGIAAPHKGLINACNLLEIVVRIG